MGNVIHRGKGSFTHVEHTVFFDRELSLKAKGSYCQIRSLEGNPEWVFTIRGFASLVKDGVDSVSAGIKELESAGYVIRARKRGEAGRFLKAEEATWITLDDPAMHDSVADELRAARVVVAVAGMEGALASAIGGLADCPVIAVPTSVGYGASFGGLSALLSMLNSCASGVSVVNIDNGFGAGYLAGKINHMEKK